MDRVVGGNKASKSNSSANTSEGHGKSTKNQSASALATASSKIGKLTSMAMMPPRQLPTAPPLPPTRLAPVVNRESHNLPRPVSVSTICSDGTAVEDVIDNYVKNGTVYGTQIKSLPNGDLKLHFSIGTTHSQLYS